MSTGVRPRSAIVVKMAKYRTEMEIIPVFLLLKTQINEQNEDMDVLFSYGLNKQSVWVYFINILTNIISYTC